MPQRNSPEYWRLRGTQIQIGVADFNAAEFSRDHSSASGAQLLTVNAARQCIFSKIINSERRQSELKTDPGISTHIRAPSRRESDIPATPTCRSGDPLN